MSYAKSSMPRLISDAVVAEVDKGEVLVSTADGSKALILNDSAAVVLSLCTGDVSLGEMIQLFCETLAIDPSRAERDLQSLLAQLDGEGLLCPHA